MQILEKGFWNSSPVKNYGSIFYLIPNGNTAMLKGPFIKEFGLKHFIVDGKVVHVPHDESLRSFFGYQPGELTASFNNYVCPYITFDQQLLATGDDSFLLRYTFNNKAREDKDVTLLFACMTDREVEAVDCSDSQVNFTFDLSKKKNVPGDGTVDFSSLREWFVEDEKMNLLVDFKRGKLETIKQYVSRSGQDSVVSQGVELTDEIFIPAGESVTFEIRLSFGKDSSCSYNVMKELWDEFSRKLPAPHFDNKEQKLAYYKSWYVLFFNEVKRKGVHWCLTGLGFPSMWVWDTSPFIADAYLNIDPVFVQNLVETQLQNLKETGMMPLHVLLSIKDKKENKEEITQIPLVANTAIKVYRQTQDKDFARLAYESLKKNYSWFETRRKPDKLVPLWGIDDKRAPYHYGPESGMDNCPVYKNGPAYSVGINSAKYSFERAMAEFASVLEMQAESQDWQDASRATQDFMLQNMWDENDTYYYALNYGLEKIRIKTSDVYPGLYVGVFPDDKVKLMSKVFEDEFLTDYGLTTVSMKEQCFDPSLYALGAVWPFMSYMIYSGLKRSGCNKLAEKVFQGTVRALSEFPGVFECYNPIEHTLGRLKDGPICIPHMSFCAGGVVSIFMMRDENLTLTGTKSKPDVCELYV